MNKLFEYDFFQSFIYKHLSAKDLYIYRVTNIKNYNNEYVKKELYNASAFFHPKYLDNSKLLINKFNIVIEDELYLPLFKYIKNDPMLLISGGYISCMYFNKPFKPESDIDIYILNGSNESLYNLFMCINFLYEIKSYIKYNNVITFKFENMRDIQIIFTAESRMIDILINFDNPHNRCAYYLGNTYITYDAEYSKLTNCTCIYNYHLLKRYSKMFYYELDILNDISNPLQLNKNVIINSPIPYNFEEFKKCVQLSVFGSWIMNYLGNNLKSIPCREVDIFNIPLGLYLSIVGREVI